MKQLQKIPPEFFRGMSTAEFRQLVEERNGYLDEAQIKRLMELTGDKGEPPKRLQLLVKRSDLERCFPRQKRH